MAWAALVQRFIKTWCIFVGSANTVSAPAEMSRCISMVVGSEARSSLRASFTTELICIGVRFSSLWRLKVRICCTRYFALEYPL
ncbi:MAG: hypothetical protein B5M55_08830 [Desulfococcus sp. 4484_242]|nr:MAG: hypothetical protein B5M55_08830 [Desulfococcus sp. 4484_242]